MVDHLIRIEPQEKSQLISIAILTLIAVAIALAYSNSYYTSLIFDDIAAIVDNPGVRQLWPIRIPDQSSLAGRPVVALTFAVNYAISGLNPWSYHVFNVVIHIANAWLFFAILRRTSVDKWPAGLLALIWALHPLNTDAVTYVTQRTELLAATFLLLTLYCAIRAASRPAWAIVAITCAALGSGAKEIMVAAPIVVMAYDAVFLRRNRPGLYAGLFSTWILVGMTLGARNETVGFGLSVNSWDYLKTQSAVIIHYLRLAIWPRPLLIDYNDWPIATRLIPVLPQACAVAALIGLTGAALGKRSVLGFLGAWFFVILAPTSSFVPIITEPAAERRMYLPLMAVIVAAAYGIARLRAPAYWGTIAAGILVVLFGAMTHRRNLDYRSEIVMWTDVVNKHPDNGRAHGSLGLALFSQHRVEEAVPHLFEEVRRYPNLASAHHNLGAAYAFLKRPAEAAKEYEEALRIDPSLTGTRRQLELLKEARPTTEP